MPKRVRRHMRAKCARTKGNILLIFTGATSIASKNFSAGIVLIGNKRDTGPACSARERWHVVAAAGRRRPVSTPPATAGGVAERLIAPVLKTGRPKGLVSSNLTPSATSIFDCRFSIGDSPNENRAENSENRCTDHVR